MKILVTGGLGFLGSHLCEHLLRQGHRVTSMDAALTLDALARGLHLSSYPAFHDWSFALAEVGTMPCRALFADVDAVIHLAAKAGVRASVRDPQGTIATNVEGTRMLLETCKTQGVSKVLFASSSSVYGHPRGSGIPSCEEDPIPAPLSPYAGSKRVGELLCELYAHLHGMDITALRLFSVYGPRQRPDLALPIFAKQLLNHEPVTLYGDGSSWRDYTYVDDIVAGMCAALDAPARQGYRCYNLGSGCPVVLTSVVQCLQDALHLSRVDVRFAPANPADAIGTYADIRTARAVLGYQPQVSFPEGVERYVRWLLT